MRSSAVTGWLSEVDRKVGKEKEEEGRMREERRDTASGWGKGMEKKVMVEVGRRRVN